MIDKFWHQGLGNRCIQCDKDTGKSGDDEDVGDGDNLCPGEDGKEEGKKGKAGLGQYHQVALVEPVCEHPCR